METVVCPLPPGPRGHFLTGCLAEFRRDILGFYSRMAREYGDVATFILARRRLILINHPDLIEQVLVTQAKNYGKLTYVLQLIMPIVGTGLLTSEGDLWLRQRRLIQPAFAKQRLAGYAEPIVAYTQRMLDTWGQGEVRDIYEDMMRLTLEISAKLLFDADVSGDTAQLGQALEVMMHNFLQRWGSFLPLPVSFPTPSNLRYLRSIRQVDEIIYRVIAERRASKIERQDVLSILLRARDEDGSRMSDRQLRDEAVTLFLAGHETTANAMSFTWYLLAQHPEILAKVRAEVQQVVGNRLPTAADVPNLRYTESVILEAMRLFPPAYAFGRKARQDCELGGYRVPAGTTVIVSQWVMHRDPRFWDNPDKFEPERWLDGRARQIHRFAYFPFGGGARLCIGNSLAMLETVLMLAVMSAHGRMDLVPGPPLQLRPAVTLKPAHGIKVRVWKDEVSG